MIQLKDILYKVTIQSVIGITSKNVNKIEYNSNKIENGNLFVAIIGNTIDGHDFISSAIKNGASAIICQKIPKETVKDITYIMVDDSRKALALICSNFFNNPSAKLKLVGITGTNGKTSCSTLLFQLFKKLNKKVGLISTNVIMIDDNKIRSNQTTPEPLLLNDILNKMVLNNVEYCFMEVSSHAISQKRIYGLDFILAAFTNLSQDHLDYHKSFKEYRDVKKEFFDSLNQSSFSLTNMDDKNGSFMTQNTKSKCFTYSLGSGSNFSLKILEKDFNGMKVLINNKELWTKVTGKFNAYNILLVYSVAKILGISEELILECISSLNSPEGRFELVDKNIDKIGIVDYAHSPDSLKNVLLTINELKERDKATITVIGCGGNRDKSKRPIMGKIASSLSDIVIFTSDNPRNENPKDIINQMIKGVDVKNINKVESEINREEAIKIACLRANSKDVILVAGKGHEKYQINGNEKIEFDDKKVLIKLLKNNY
jgi:UDP-N-acetylmuramoyl-L-alanyl-D-glutamate--2,6-diaminopimelate ligase